MRIYNYFNSKVLIKSLPFYIPISLGIFNKLNSISLFIIPLQAISSISKKTLNPRLKEALELVNFPLPNDDNLFKFFCLLILLITITFIFSNILKKFFILRIKKKIFSANKRKKIYNKQNINYYNKKFEKVNYYIKTTEEILFCSILVFIIFFVDYQIALITIFGGISYYLIVSKLRLLRVKSKKENIESIVSKYKRKNYFNFIFEQFFNDTQLLKGIGSSIIMLIILLAIYKRTDPTISIIFIFLIRIFQNQMIQSLNQFISKKEK